MENAFQNLLLVEPLTRAIRPPGAESSRLAEGAIMRIGLRVHRLRASPDYLALAADCCSTRIALNRASSISVSSRQPAGSTNGFGPPDRSLAYLAFRLYCAG